MNCSVRGCGRNRRNSRYDKVQFFRFPTVEQLRVLWVDFCDNDELILRPNSRICSDHFDESSFKLNSQGNRKRRRDAVPSLKGPGKTFEAAVEARMCFRQSSLRFPSTLIEHSYTKCYIDATGSDDNNSGEPMEREHETILPDDPFSETMNFNCDRGANGAIEQEVKSISVTAAEPKCASEPSNNPVNDSRFSEPVNDVMDSSEADIKVKRQCRLCLQCFGPGYTPEWMVDVFRPEATSSSDVREDNSLATLIMDSIGITIARDDAVAEVCRNCAQTVQFMAEFQALCRDANDVYRSLMLASSDFTLVESYREAIGTLLDLTKGKRKQLNANIFSMRSVKQEDSEDCASEDLADSEAIFLAQEQLVTPEMCTDVFEVSVTRKPELQQTPDVDVAGPAQQKSDNPGSIYVNADRMALANAIKNKPVLWKSDFPGYHNPKHKANVMAKIAKELGTEVNVVKFEWKRLLNLYRFRRGKTLLGEVSSEPALDPIYKVLDEMVAEGLKEEVPPPPQEAEKTQPLSQGQLIELAKRVADSDVLWNVMSDTTDTSEAWAVIAAEFGMTVKSMLLEWRKLMVFYRSIRRDGHYPDGSRKCTELDLQLYRKLRTIIGRKDLRATNGQILTREKRIQLVTRVFDDKVLYDKDELASCSPMQLEENTKKWASIATQFGVSVDDIKMEWNRLLEWFHIRQRSFELGILTKFDPQMKDELYVLLDVMFGNGKSKQLIHNSKRYIEDSDVEEVPVTITPRCKTKVTYKQKKFK